MQIRITPKRIAVGLGISLVFAPSSIWERLDAPDGVRSGHRLAVAGVFLAFVVAFTSRPFREIWTSASRRGREETVADQFKKTMTLFVVSVIMFLLAFKLLDALGI